MARRYFPKSTEELLHWYERYVSPFALLVGFLLDNFFFIDRVDTLQTQAIFAVYLVIAGVAIVLLHFIEMGHMRNRLLVRVSPVLPVVLQFVFGGLFSGYLALYARSATLMASWVFVIVLAALLIGNERFRRFYTHVAFQLSLYFVALLLFFAFFVPVVLHRVGSTVFILSTIVSLLAIVVLAWILDRWVPEVMRKGTLRTTGSVAGIFVLFNICYFTNILPPLPLALKDAGVYHHVAREAGKYQLRGELQPWYAAWIPRASTYHATMGEGAYVYSAIFAPTDLSTGILHEWQWYDDARRAWITEARVTFPISGGRDGGYRGYSFKSAPREGRWRVNVLTDYGRLIGRVSFTVEEVSVPPVFESLVK